MTPRANWKGVLKIEDLVCAIALYAAASTSERVAFHILNRATGHRVRRRFIDSETGETVEKEDQVKGYEKAAGDDILLEDDEIANVAPESDKIVNVIAFVGLDDIEEVYFDKPYYLVPADIESRSVYALIREGMRSRKVVALARVILFRRMRTLLIQPIERDERGEGLVAMTLNFDYEVLSPSKAFEDIPSSKADEEMVKLAEHIIKTRMGRFDPETFDDRYETALTAIVKAKIEGRRIEPPQKKPPENVIDLMTALRESATLADGAPVSRKRPGNASSSKKTLRKREAN
ncbi:non-homologous end joining protein Ku [Beijerinckia mobilis]|uniref:non-homologous end joining protein Ku n=1 Tax=Beijerinckia mobilis TaxID=231434 RepID=UPI000557841C|nr:Ku protein [Beijerinckia mobilis]